jgi:hypothetical protein
MNPTNAELTTRISILVTLLVSTVFIVNSLEDTMETKKQNATYLKVVRSYGNETINKRADNNLIAIGRKTCELLDNGTTSSMLIETIVKASGLQEDPEALSYLTVDAVNIYCPQHFKQISAG